MTRLLDARAAAEVLGVSPSLVLALVRSGELPHLRLGRLVRIPDDALERWIADQTRYPGSHAAEGERLGVDLSPAGRPAPPTLGGGRRRRLARRTARPADALRVLEGGG